MDNKQASVRLEHVTKRFKNVNGRDDVYAVKDSNLEIKSGELVTLLGPSGCGKTTTLRMIAGFELPSEGKVFIGENDVTMLPPNKRDTATVFQSYGLFPHMNVFE
ncbi:MAG: ATP-binding cassette domain-containing protein, partial [Spirochaetaceae bacterium]|nr:ATP-binding cassette domain-containing protein [Spirochaetaceae bacterium]